MVTKLDINYLYSKNSEYIHNIIRNSGLTCINCGKILNEITSYHITKEILEDFSSRVIYWECSSCNWRVSLESAVRIINNNIDIYPKSFICTSKKHKPIELLSSLFHPKCPLCDSRMIEGEMEDKSDIEEYDEGELQLNGIIRWTYIIEEKKLDAWDVSRV